MSTNKKNTFAVTFPGVSLGQKTQLSSSVAGIFDIRNDVGQAGADANAGSGGLSQALQMALQAAGNSVTQANQQMEQLLTAQQKALQSTDQNTQALAANTSSKGGGSTALNTLGDIASNMFGGSILSPIISGIMSLFGGSSQSSTPTFQAYLPPLPVQVNQTVGSPTPTAPTATQTTTSNSGSSSAGAHVTIQVNAMDSQSFMDHSDAIAQAVRQALLNSHPLGDVISEL